MNNKIYGKLIFELSHPGSEGYSLPKNEFPRHEVPAAMRRATTHSCPSATS
jgi:glycine dehydrogenase subunit 2